MLLSDRFLGFFMVPSQGPWNFNFMGKLIFFIFLIVLSFGLPFKKIITRKIKRIVDYDDHKKILFKVIGRISMNLE